MKKLLGTIAVFIFIFNSAYGASLKGTRQSQKKQNIKADIEDLSRIENDVQLRKMIEGGYLVSLPHNKYVEINSRLAKKWRFCRPWVRDFLLERGKKYHKEFKQPLPVNSGVRTKKHHRKLRTGNVNAAPVEGPYATSHTTGATINIGKLRMSAAGIKWMRQELLNLEQRGLIEATEEHNQAVFHVMVFKNYDDMKKTKEVKEKKKRENITVRVQTRQKKPSKMVENIIEKTEALNKLSPQEVLKQVAQAKKILQGKKTGYKVCREKKWGWAGKGKRRKKINWQVYYPCKINYLLAITTAKDKEIKLVRLSHNHTGKADGFEIEPILINGYPNGVGRQFVIHFPRGYFTLAIKRAVRIHDGTIREVINTPYSQGLDLPEVRQEGLKYLNDLLKKARVDLKRLKVPSWASPGSTVDETVPLRVPLVLNIIEHLDPERFSRESIKSLMRENFVILAANKGNAYRYSVSSSGARSLFQLTPDTYERVFKGYPKARLNSNFVRGAEDHNNAARAELCLLDADLWYLGQRRYSIMKKDQIQLGRYLAACYNYGAPRTRHALTKHGLKRWLEHLPQETRIYIKKFDAVYNLLYGSAKTKNDIKKEK